MVVVVARRRGRRKTVVSSTEQIFPCVAFFPPPPTVPLSPPVVFPRKNGTKQSNDFDNHLMIDRESECA